MKMKLFIIKIVILASIPLGACENRIRESNTPAEASINMMMSIEDGNFEAFKS